MKIVEVNWTPFRLPLRAPFRTAATVPWKTFRALTLMATLRSRE